MRFVVVISRKLTLTVFSFIGQISAGELVEPPTTVPAKNAWSTLAGEQTKTTLPARVKARLIRGERKLSPAATAAWHASRAIGARLDGGKNLLEPNETVALVRLLAGKEDIDAAIDATTHSPISVAITGHDEISHEDHVGWETVSGRKNAAKAKASKTHPGGGRSRRASTDGNSVLTEVASRTTSSDGESSGKGRGKTRSVASSENGSLVSSEGGTPPKAQKGWAAILVGQKSSSELTPSEAAQIAGEEAAAEAAARRVVDAKEAEQAAAAEETRAKARAAAAEKRAAETAVAETRAKSTHVSVPDTAPCRTSSPAPLNTNSKPSGPWACVVSGDASNGNGGAATEGWRSLVEARLDAETAPHVTVTLDGWDSDGSRDAKKRSSSKPKTLVQLSRLELAPAMPVVRTAQKAPPRPAASSEPIPAHVSSAQAGPSWSGWAVNTPPPKVDLKAEMEAALVVRAASPTPAVAKPETAAKRPGDQTQNAKKGKSGTERPVHGVSQVPKPGTTGVNGRNGAGNDLSNRSFSPSPPSSPPLTLPGASRFQTRPFAAPPAPPRAPAPEAQLPKLVFGAEWPTLGLLGTATRLALEISLGKEMLDTPAYAAVDSEKASALAAERTAVENLIRAIHGSARSLFPNASTEVFGSFPTNSWVPGASNVDVALSLPDAVSSTPQTKLDALSSLAAALRLNKWVGDVTVVPSALRPLIFVTTRAAYFTQSGGGGVGDGAGAPPLPPGPPPPGATGKGVPATDVPELQGTPLEVHISIKDRAHKGAATVKFLRQAETEYPALASVLCVQKTWLAKKGLRGVYKGGIGSYSLALLALHALQRKAFEDAAKRVGGSGITKACDETGPDTDARVLGSSLLYFLEFYGMHVDLTKSQVVSHPLKPTGKAAKKAAAAAAASGERGAEWGVVPAPRVSSHGPPIAGLGGLTVKDPNQPGHNAGGGCFGIAGVQASFREQLALVASTPGNEGALRRLTH